MKQIWKYIKEFVKEDYSPGYYLAVALYIAVLLFFGYYYDLENDYLDPLYGSYKHYVASFLSFCVAYFGTFLIQGAFRKNHFKQSSRFWIAVFACLLIESHDLSMHWHRLTLDWFPGELRVLMSRTIKNIMGVFTVLIPVYLFHKFTKSGTNYYGLTTRGFQYKPYVFLSLVSLVGIALSLYNGDLSSYYPTYKPYMGRYFEENAWIGAMIYEFFYGLDFVGIELIFRGFMVVGLSKWLGKDAILPMVTTYCVLHFGKPLPEAISSIFGGYLLGVLAYKSKNIMGGVMLHITIALGMEFFAWLFSIL